MGLDTVIAFKLRAGASEDVLRAFMLPPDFSIIPKPGYFDISEATHEVSNPWRYYGVGYERGPWPYIACVLMQLMQCPEIEKVYYGDDCSGPEEIQPALVAMLNMHYMMHGRRPYTGEKPGLVPDRMYPKEVTFKY